MTAGISPALGGTYVTGSSAPVTTRAAWIMSFTETDSPAPRISSPVAPARQASSIPATTSSTCTRSRTWLPSPYTWMPPPSRAARIVRGTKLSFSAMPWP